MVSRDLPRALARSDSRAGIAPRRGLSRSSVAGPRPTCGCAPPTPVNDPALGFGVTSTCADGTGRPVAPIMILLDLPRVENPRGPRHQHPRGRRCGPAPRALPSRVRTARVARPASGARAMEPRVAEPRSSADGDRRSRGASAAHHQRPPQAAATPTQSGPEFVLRLSSPIRSTCRARAPSTTSRAPLLRERLRLLDNDDQVAAMLALRDNMQRLEARVAEL